MKYKSILLHKIQKEITVQNGAYCFTCKTRDWEKERNYKVAQRRTQYVELQECTQWSQQWCSTAAIQLIKPYDTNPPVPRAT